MSMPNGRALHRYPPSELISSILCDETSFYNLFTKDLRGAENEVIIESPFISTKRAKVLRPLFQKLVHQGVCVFVMTRDPREQSDGHELQSEDEIRYFEAIGVQVLLCVGNHHRKLAMIDRTILWEGSLNILSQTHSREIMRRMESQALTEDMFTFLKLGKWIY